MHSFLDINPVLPNGGTAVSTEACFRSENRPSLTSCSSTARAQALVPRTHRARWRPSPKTLSSDWREGPCTRGTSKREHVYTEPEKKSKAGRRIGGGGGGGVAWGHETYVMGYRPVLLPRGEEDVDVREMEQYEK